MKKFVSACFVLVMICGAAVAQKKPWTEWTKKDVEKTLSDSAWSQTQSEGGQQTPTQIQTISTTTTGRREDSSIGAASRTESGQTKPSNLVKYHVRFLSAKPIRAAFARQVMLSQTTPNEALNSQLEGFVNRDFAEYIVVSVGVEVADEKMSMPLMRAFTTATTDVLKENVYLERKDGKKLFLMEYRAPTQDGMGAKFVFQRLVDGQPFLSQSDSVRFIAQFNEKMKLNTKYNLSEMLYDGKLEY
jgi:hypothetical protein